MHYILDLTPDQALALDQFAQSAEIRFHPAGSMAWISPDAAGIVRPDADATASAEAWLRKRGLTQLPRPEPHELTAQYALLALLGTRFVWDRSNPLDGPRSQQEWELAVSAYHSQTENADESIAAPSCYQCNRRAAAIYDTVGQTALCQLCAQDTALQRMTDDGEMVPLPPTDRHPA